MKRKTKFLLLILILTAAAYMGIKTVYRTFPLRYAEYVERYSKEYRLDKYMVFGTIYAESGFDKEAHSGLARGLMQLTDQTAAWIADKMGIDYEYDMAEEPEINIKMGCYYLCHLLEKYETPDTAIAAYNAGMGNVSKWLSDGRYSKDGKTLFDMPYEETKNYVKRVKVFAKIYKALYGKRLG